MADALSRLPNHIELVGVPNQTCGAHMFTLQPEWLRSVYKYLFKGVMRERLTTSQRQYLTQRAKPFMLQKQVLYIFGQDNRFRQFCNQNKYPQFCKNYMEELQEGIFLLISLCKKS
jgi:hypothetical protein